jgi:hypothetical protein
MNCPSRESVNFQRSICDTLPKRNIDPTICLSTSVLLCQGSSTNYKECIEVKVVNVVVENVSNGDCPKSLAATSPSRQFPLFSTNTDNANQLASKAKDSLEDKKKKGSWGSNDKKKKSGSL